MRLHRFFGNFNFKSRQLFVSDPELVVQWRDVLRFEPGSECILCDGKLNEALARIVLFKKNSAEVEIIGISRNDNEPERAVTLYLAVLKGEHFGLVAEKVTELGAVKIVPVISERTIKQNIREDRLRKIIKEAAEQSGRGITPELGEPLPLLVALRHASADDAKLFFHPEGKAVKDFAGRFFKTASIFIGPEGGWSEAETALAKRSEFSIASLGKLTLRAETAAIVAAYSLLSN